MEEIGNSVVCMCPAQGCHLEESHWCWVRVCEVKKKARRMREGQAGQDSPEWVAGQIPEGQEGAQQTGQ